MDWQEIIEKAKKSLDCDIHSTGRPCNTCLNNAIVGLQGILNIDEQDGE